MGFPRQGYWSGLPFSSQEDLSDPGIEHHMGVITIYILMQLFGFPAGANGKESTCNAGDQGLISGSGRSSEEGNCNPLQYPCLENPMDRGAWSATVHGVSKESDMT